MRGQSRGGNGSFAGHHDGRASPSRHSRAHGGRPWRHL